MKKNSILQIIGQKQDINLYHEQAMQVEAVFSDGEIPNEFIIRLTDPPLSFKKGTIRTIEVRPDGGRNDSNQKNFDDFYEEERKNRLEKLSWSKEKLASFVDVFGCLYQISAGEVAKEEVLEEARQVQFSFFKENRQRTLCDLYLLKPLIPMRVSKIDLWQSGFFRLVEKAIFRDMQLSGQLKNKVNLPNYKEPAEEESIEEMKTRAEINKQIDENFNETVRHAVENF